MANSLKNWRKKFFRKEIFSPGRSEVLAQAPREAAFVLRAMGLKKGAKLLDLCCGTGRHSLIFAKRGLDVTGLDATPAYLREAERRGRGLKNLRFVKGDMRRLPYREEFDAVVNLWTSFGYFLDPADDLKTLKAVARALKPGGLFLIDLVNAGWLDRHLVPRNWTLRDDGTYLLEEVKVLRGRDLATTNSWTVIGRNGKTASATFFVRNYDYARLAGLMRKAGLAPQRRWGALDASPFREDGRRMAILARKKP